MDQALEGQPDAEIAAQVDAQHRAGLALRKRVMGEDFVTRAQAGADGFTRILQDHINREAWGTVWQRTDLDLRTRSMVTVAMLVAMGRTNELKGHVRGALNNGVTVAELRGIFLHATIYCGVPLAAEAFRAGLEVIEAARQAPGT
jgi:4-carboxymuconolactone decarboxylase